MAARPGDRNYGGPQYDPYRNPRDPDPRWPDTRWPDQHWSDDPRHPSFAGTGSRRSKGGYRDAQDEERMRRAQADFDYRGGGEEHGGEWDEQLGGYRYTGRDYPEERYAARSGQGRDYGHTGRSGQRHAAERYRPQWAEETTGRSFAGPMGEGFPSERQRRQRYGGQDFYEDAARTEVAWSGAEGTLGEGRPDYRGRGPAGYRRSDERIREDVNDCLTDDPYLDASGIQVRVQNCEVTLDGTVNSRACKRRAENLVEEIAGVRHVQNNLRVKDTEHREAQGTSTVQAMPGLRTAPSPEEARRQTAAADQTSAMKSEIGKASS